MYKITDLATNETISVEELGMRMYRSGANNLVYCDIDGIAEMDGEYAILDECGNYAWIDQKKYRIERVDNA